MLARKSNALTASAPHAIGTLAADTAFPPHLSLSSALVLHHHPHRQISRPSPPLSLSYNLPFPSSASAFLVPVLRIATYDPDVTAQIALSTDVSDVPMFPLNTKKVRESTRKVYFGSFTFFRPVCAVRRASRFLFIFPALLFLGFSPTEVNRIDIVSTLRAGCRKIGMFC